MTKTNSFIIEYDAPTDKWVTYAWVDGLHTLEDEKLRHGSEDTHDTIDEAVRHIKAWQSVERIVNHAIQNEWNAPSANDIVVEAIAPGVWSITNENGERRLSWDHVDALRAGCAEVSSLTA